MDRGAHDEVSNRVPEYRLLPIRHDLVQTVRRPIVQDKSSSGSAAEETATNPSASAIPALPTTSSPYFLRLAQYFFILRDTAKRAAVDIPVRVLFFPAAGARFRPCVFPRAPGDRPAPVSAASA